MFFSDRSKKKCIYALCVGLAEDNTIPTKPPISKQQSPTHEKQEAITLCSNVSISLEYYIFFCCLCIGGIPADND